jgi:hypothetical protein
MIHSTSYNSAGSLQSDFWDDMRFSIIGFIEREDRQQAQRIKHPALLARSMYSQEIMRLNMFLSRCSRVLGRGKVQGSDRCACVSTS